MIGFWIAAALLTAVVLLLLLRPLMRAPITPAGGDPAAQAVYRDQLDEVARDLDRGLLSPDQARAVRAEVGRRLLSAAAQARDPGAGPRPLSPVGRRVWAGLLLALVPATALAVYLKVGSPDLPAQPAGARSDQPSMPAPAAALVAGLEQATRDHPDDPAAWGRLGEVMAASNHYDKAAEALRRAVALAPGNPTLQGALAEALTQAGDGIVSPDAKAAIAAALAIDPNEPRARYYDGLALRQAGDLKGAIAHWGAFLAASPADAPWVPFLRGQIGETAAEAGLDPAKVTPRPRPAQTPPGPPADAGPGPTADQMAAAGALSPDQRDRMIHAMVDRLAHQLKDHPQDPDGWRRLARAYQVLGDRQKAGEAEANASRYAQTTAQTTGIAAPTSGATATPEGDGDAAMRREVAAMTPAQRAAKIDSLLAGLASRAQANPGDGAGWARLAQAYDVTGRAAQAKAAWAKALAAAPEDNGVALAYARSLLPADGQGTPPAAFYTVLEGVLKRAPANPQALWYLGERAAEAGRVAEARTLWGRLLDTLPADSPDRAALRQRIDTLGGAPASPPPVPGKS